MMYTNIDEVVVDDIVIGNERVDNKFDGDYSKLKAIVIDKTSNTVELMIYSDNKVNGVDARQWMRFGDLIKQFKFA